MFKIILQINFFFYKIHKRAIRRGKTLLSGDTYWYSKTQEIRFDTLKLHVLYFSNGIKTVTECDFWVCKD
jgi:hypothetical protein